MSSAAAFFVSLACGAAVNVLLTVWSAWRLRNGSRERSAASFFIVLGAMLGVPLVLAFLMPDFDTALVAWLGFGVGYAVGMLLSLPLSGLLAARIARRSTG